MMTMIHSFWAYLTLALLVIVVIKAVTSLKKEFKDIDLRLALFTLIVSHIQLLLGLGVYFFAKRRFDHFQKPRAVIVPNEFIYTHQRIGNTVF